MKEKLLRLKEPKSYKTGDHSEIICCPFCKLDFERMESYYLCKTHGEFNIDESGRPILIDQQVYKKNTGEHQSGINWLKSFFKQFPKVYYSIWHVFCPVMMLVNGPRMILDFIAGNKNIILDVGSGPERLGKEFINVDVFPFPEVDIVANAENLPFRDNSIDAVVSESLIEHVPDAYKVAQEITRIIKPGGYIYISAPFIHPYHASPDDFNRWTISGLKHLFPDFIIVKSGVRSGPWSAFLIFLAYWLGVVFSFGFRRLAPFLAHVFMIILGPLKYFDYFFIKMPGSEAVAAHLFILGRKK